MTADTTEGRWSDLLQPRYAAATLTLCLGVALFAFNEFLVSTAMPTAVGELGGVALVSWTLTLFLVASIAAGVSAAALKARFGARHVLLAAAAVFLLGTLVAAGAGSMPMVLAGRLLQGAGEGVIAALCYALIPELFPSRLVPKVFGAEAMVWAVSAFGGPLVSGAITETISWRAAFLVNVPVIALFAALVLLVVPRGGGAGDAALPPAGRLLAITCGIVAVALAGIVEGGAPRAALLVAAAAMLAGAVRFDRGRPDALFPATAFAFRDVVGVGLWMVFLMPLAQASTTVYVVLTTERLWGYGPTMAGAVNAVLALSWSATAVAAASVGGRSRRRALVGGGPILLAIGLAAVAASFTVGGPVWLVAGMAAIGVGFGASWGYLSQFVMEAAVADERDRAAALLPSVQAAGYAAGAALAGLAANTAGFPSATTADAIAAAATKVFGVATLVALVSVAAGLAVARLDRQARASAK